MEVPPLVVFKASLFGLVGIGFDMVSIWGTVFVPEELRIKTQTTFLAQICLGRTTLGD